MSFDDTLGFGKIVASSVEGPHSFTLYNVSGISALDFTSDDSDEGGEVGISEEAYQALGIIGRPLPPNGDDALEALFARTGDGLVPFAYRDARLHRHFPNPGEGDVAFVSYGGGFHSMSLNSAGETIHTLYCPFDFQGGVPQKAHAITLDPSGHISVVHSDGFAVVLAEDGITLRGGGSTWLKLSDGKFEVVAASISLTGNCALGANTAAAVPLLAGPASPPSPSVFVSPV